MKLDALIRDVRPLAVAGPTDAEVRGITVDSRQVRPGFVFAAVPGAQRDGWEYAEDAVERGAVAVVAQREGRLRRRAAPAGGPRPPDVCLVRVGDVHQAVGELAAAFHGHPAARLQVAGITGTNGKTTVAHMMRDILRRDGRAPGMIGTVTYEIGARAIPASRTTPEACELQALLAQMVGVGCRSAVMEVSSHSLDQKRTAGIDFDVGIFTNLTRDHLDYHRDMETYFAAKRRLFEGLGRGGKRAAAVVNRDDPWGRRLVDLADGAAERVTYGLAAEATVRAERVELRADGTTFELRSPWGAATIRMGLMGRHNISNALAAIAGSALLGASIETAAAALADMACVPGRLELIDSGRGFPVFVDYAHTDDALANVLATLREITAGRLIVVFGCGGNRDRTKRPIMGAVAARLADYTILTSDNPRKEEPASILAEIRAGFGSGGNCEQFEDRRQAIRRALELGARGDVVLVAGKGHETFQEFANTSIPFDDRQVVRELLGRAG